MRNRADAAYDGGWVREFVAIQLCDGALDLALECFLRAEELSRIVIESAQVLGGIAFLEDIVRRVDHGCARFDCHHAAFG